MNKDEVLAELRKYRDIYVNNKYPWNKAIELVEKLEPDIVYKEPFDDTNMLLSHWDENF